MFTHSAQNHTNHVEINLIETHHIFGMILQLVGMIRDVFEIVLPDFSKKHLIDDEIANDTTNDL